MEVVATRPPENGEVYMRWRLHLWPRDVLSIFSNAEPGRPSVVDGYSRYLFDPWTAAVVTHTIDIVNPPTLLGQFLSNGQPAQAWGAPLVPGMLSQEDSFHWRGQKLVRDALPGRRSKLDQAARTWARRSHVIAMLDD
jgi:hypothetical protein